MMSIRTLFLAFLVSTISILFTLGCAQKLKPEQSPELKTYLSMDVPTAKYTQILDRLQNQLHKKLKSRGEAHLTFLTPPEFSVLTQKAPLTAQEIHKLSSEFLKADPQVHWICLGTGSKEIAGQIESTYYIVAQALPFLTFRKMLSEKSKLPLSQFDPNLFFPHITLGFTSRDLHFEDGLKKDEQSCPEELQNLLKVLH